MVRLVQRNFMDGTPPLELAWKTMVLTPKGNGEYRGIGIIEVSWKVCAAAVNCRLKRGFILHNALHGFREGQGTGTATLEAKLVQHLSGISQKPLFQFFLDIRKVYDSLDRGKFIEVLRCYGMGTNLACLLKSYWDRQRIVPKMGKFLGK